MNIKVRVCQFLYCRPTVAHASSQAIQGTYYTGFFLLFEFMKQLWWALGVDNGGRG